MSTSLCDRVAAELVAYVDGEQPEAERVRIEAHLRTCLSCRREADGIAKVNALLRGLPQVEPAADLGERMRQRLEVDGRDEQPRRTWRPALWGLPALAAAAVAALVLYSTLFEAGTNRSAGAGAGRTTRLARAGAPSPAAERVVAPVAEGPEHATIVAGDAPEDVPRDLIEHPELFLRLPVVRRLDKLEHFEEVRRQGAPEKLGRTGASAWTVG